jgi:gliding motility-associated-like protein
MVTFSGPTSFCDGDSLVLTSAFTSGNQWYRNNLPLNGATQNSYIVTTSGSYKVRYTPVSGSPVFSDSVQVTVYTLPNNVTSVSDTVCQGSQATLAVLPQTGISYNWYDVSTGGISLGTGLAYTTPALIQNQSFFVELANTFGCVRNNRFEIVAMVHPQPAADFISSVPNHTASGFEVLFTNNTTGATSYYWNFGDPSSTGNTANTQDASHLYSLPGDYTITLVVTNSEGCSDTLSKILSVVLDNNIFIPSGFTPNNDGNNDLFRVRGNNIRFSNISIYNQWGQRIWYSPNEINGWDGTSNGDRVTNGSYAYAIEVTYDNGTTQMFRGNINVIR